MQDLTNNIIGWWGQLCLYTKNFLLVVMLLGKSSNRPLTTVNNKRSDWKLFIFQLGAQMFALWCIVIEFYSNLCVQP